MGDYSKRGRAEVIEFQIYERERGGREREDEDSR